ncbi:MAG TPA: hypothetical protein VFV38_10200 [Ktedonobacteraceae bacterium]|nr:hypothetical protein [Ktedonobacteraceae bacterium]
MKHQQLIGHILIPFFLVLFLAGCGGTGSTPSPTQIKSSPYPVLASTYKGTLTTPPLTSDMKATVSSMALILTSEDQQGHIAGRLAVLLIDQTGGDPFTGTVSIDGTVVFTADSPILGGLTTFRGMVNRDRSITGTTDAGMYQSDSWRLSPA